jgi:hypothetical protein
MNKNLFLSAVFVLATLLLLPSCKKDPEGPTDLRIRNMTTSVFKNVVVNTSGGEYNYGVVAPGNFTDYHRFDVAYRQAAISLEINSVQYELVPVDYTYEVPLGQGKFTYELSIADTAARTLAVHVTADAPL